MKSVKWILILIAVMLAVQGVATAQFINGQNANVVLGQADFTTSTSATTQNGMYHPWSVAIDASTGKVFVADTYNNRVLRFSSTAAATSGSAAEAVLGQPDFTTSTPATTPNGMYFPTGVAVDANGNLYVAEYANNRVLRFINAAAKASGAAADSVLGQPDFTTGTTATTQNGLRNPYGVAVDTAGNLYVADNGNNRVLRFSNAVADTNGANADGVLGQAYFTTQAHSLMQSGMSYPTGVAVDAAGNLYVADNNNSRVLRFGNAATAALGANADGILGQADFTSNGVGLGQNGMTYPTGVAVDATGNLYVVDANNNRVLRFINAAAKANGANADGVLGQTDFTSNTDTTTRSGMNQPSSVAVDASGNLYVAEQGNNRVLRFNSGSQTKTPVVQSGMPKVFALMQNYPNPFNPTTTIAYSLAQTGPVTLKVYDVLGREVATLVNEHKASGSYTVSFEARRYSSGIYFYKLQSGNFVQTKKMMLVK